jgi:outer membrane protein assembly factor BamB
MSGDGASVFISSSDWNLYAVNSADGSQKWSHTTTAPVHYFIGVLLSPDLAVTFAPTDYHHSGTEYERPGRLRCISGQFVCT